MYHGNTVPGFPQHPHRGFEAVSYVRRGTMDHADSLGAKARFSAGDVQWITAGAGIQHAEMFPLLYHDGPNELEMFQIWLNLPAADKMAEPAFRMYWNEHVPTFEHRDAERRATRIVVIAGSLLAAPVPLDPPPSSWAARGEADVAIWHIELDPNAEWVLPAAEPGTTRAMYVFDGHGVSVTRSGTGPHELLAGQGAPVDCSSDIEIHAMARGASILILQGRPINEPVAQYGPFVMNTQAELQTAMADYRRTQFGGWPWLSPAPNHGQTAGRFAVHPDGTEDTPTEPKAGR